MAAIPHEEYELLPPTSIYATSTTKLIVANEEHLLSEPDLGAASAYKNKTVRQRWGGRKLTLRLYAVIALLVLVANIAFVVYSLIHYGNHDGYGTIMRGNCDEVNRLNFGLHLAINVLSTLLLLGSNTFMQAFSAPTRKEIDKAHAKRKWLHIGILSLRNFTKVSKHKAFICLILALSSIPFHLLYNSLVYKTVSTNMYNWVVVSSGFPFGAPFSTTQTLTANGDVFRFENGDVNNNSQPSYIVNLQKNAKSWQNLTATDCIRAYGNDIAPTRKDVVVVSSDVNNRNSLFKFGFAGSGDLNYDEWNGWICSQFEGGGMGCDANAVAAESTWTVGGHPIAYCLSEQTEAICSVNYSLWIGVVVISCNVVKFLAMVFVLFRFDVEKLLTTPGDAMADFLQAEDSTTRGLCLGGSSLDKT